jgi:hypothetical protein
MKRFLSRLCVGLFATAVLAESGFAPKALTWQEVRDKFEAANPTLRAGKLALTSRRRKKSRLFFVRIRISLC